VDDLPNRLNIIGIGDFKKNLSSKRLSNYRKLLILFPRWEDATFLKLMEIGV